LGREFIDVHRFLADIDNPVFFDAAFFVGPQFIARLQLRSLSMIVIETYFQ
jgi:hypothetical protein